MMMASMDMYSAYIVETDMKGKFYRLFFWPQTSHVKHSQDANNRRPLSVFNLQAQQRRNNNKRVKME